jgi:hypothetical protein
VIDGFAVLDLDESASGATNILQEKDPILELDFSVVATDALIQDQNLVGRVPSYFGSLILD